MPQMRTQTEIVARLKVPRDSFIGDWMDVLLDALPFEAAKEFLTPEATPERWNVKRQCAGFGPELQFPLLVEADLKTAALAYLSFAWGKAEDHRGISAERGVEKMTEFCWLLGHDVKVIEDAEYAQYGCPQLKVVAELLGAPLPTSPELVRMMHGEPCVEGCSNGCGQ